MSTPTFNAMQRKVDFDASAVGGLKAFSCEVLFRHANKLYNNALYFETDFSKEETWTCLRQGRAICKLINDKLETSKFLKPSTEKKFRELCQDYEAKEKSVAAFHKRLFEKNGAPSKRQSEEEDYFLSNIRIQRDEDFFNLDKITTIGIFQAMAPYPTDAELVVDDQSIKVHRHILSLLSPVFKACFTHDTREALTGVIEIKDFDLSVVQMVVDYCYGREVGNIPIADVIGILRFADKYDIKPITTKLRRYPFTDLTINKFCVVAHYAWDLNIEDLKEQCCRFYRRKHAELTLTSDFAELPIHVREDLLNGAIAFRQIYPDADLEDE